MPLIRLETLIDASVERCFDLARDIDLHMRSTEQTSEIAVAGVTSGLIGPGEEVTWEATHFGVRQRLTSKITAFNRPSHFRDSQIQGAFKRFDHDHYFKSVEAGKTLMRDDFDYQAPLGWIGAVADRLFLKRHMRVLLEKRNLLIKTAAETSD